jgi:hypothetical protein
MQDVSLKLPPHEIPVLLTSSVVAHDNRVRLKDTNERIRLAMESVAEWLKIEARQPLVLCDGSSFDFTDRVRVAFPQARIECLTFENPQELVRQHGRGYGEGEIVRYAINHSSFIAGADCFAKCSSKLWVQNFPECARAWQGGLLLHGVFLDALTPWGQPTLSYIDTRFYISSRTVYRQYFEEAHLRINKSKQYGLENAFKSIFLESGLRQAFSPLAPVICGVGGAIGQHYKNSLKRRLKEDLRLWLVRHQPRWRDYFIEA